jgi:hypothetical protein
VLVYLYKYLVGKEVMALGIKNGKQKLRRMAENKKKRREKKAQKRSSAS